MLHATGAKSSGRHRMVRSTTDAAQARNSAHKKLPGPWAVRYCQGLTEAVSQGRVLWSAIWTGDFWSELA